MPFVAVEVTSSCFGAPLESIAALRNGRDLGLSAAIRGAAELPAGK